ncbi:hypothetical protein ACP275_08G012900 [Erythranthe tilingii]
MQDHQIRFIVGIIGNIISAFLFISPSPTFWRICKNKSTQEFHPYPYLATLMNCILWIFYGIPIVHPDSTLVVSINGFGLALTLIYLSIFFYYTTKKNRVIMCLVLLAEAAAFASICIPTLLAAHTHDKRSTIVGTICIVFGIIMYGSPLSVAWKVIKTKSAEFLPIWLCVTGFVNGIIWFAYACLSKKIDINIAVPNGVGALLGFIQICIYGYYTFINPGNKDKPAEVQLPEKKTLPV